MWCDTGTCASPCSDSDWVAGRDDSMRNVEPSPGPPDASEKMYKLPPVQKPEEQYMNSPGFEEVKKDKSSKNDIELEVVDAPAQEQMDSSAAAGENTDEEVAPCCILNGPRMDEDSILNHGQWCCYACCCGVGWLKETNSPCHCLTKCICLQHTCEMVEHESQEGVCGCMQTCCFCTPMFQVPPPESTPRCMCCGARWNAAPRSDKDKKKVATVDDDPYTRFENVAFEQCQPCFCLCAGCGCEPFFQTVYDAYFKCLCCRYTALVLPPCEPEGVVCCRGLVNAGLCIAQCRYPCKFAGNPIIACCGQRCKQNTHSPGQFA